MNTQLIPVFAGNIQNQSTQLVDARLLHQFLESSQQFANWIKNKIKDYGFVENQDYLLNKFIKQVPHQSGFRNQEVIDYHLTLDMGKEVSMVERNAKGQQARRYFINCEKRLTEQLQATSALNNNITINLAPLVDGKHRRWLVTQVLDEMTVLMALRPEQVLTTHEEAAQTLIDQGYIVKKADDLLAFLAMQPMQLPLLKADNSQTLQDAIIKAIADTGATGVTERDMRRKYPFSRLSDTELTTVINRLVKADLVTLINTREGKPGKARMAFIALK